MAQTTNGMSSRDLKAEGGSNGTTWTDLSGFATKVEIEDLERQAGEVNTFDGDIPIITAGKRKATKIKISVVYTEGVSDAWPTIRDAFQAGSAYYVRLSPRGGQTSETLYTSTAGVITKLIMPNMEAGPGDVVIAGFELMVADLVDSTAA